jgi:hypothetical protein
MKRVAKSKMMPAKRPFTPEEDDLILTMFGAGARGRDVLATLRERFGTQRHSGTIYRRAEALGQPVQGPRKSALPAEKWARYQWPTVHQHEHMTTLMGTARFEDDPRAVAETRCQRRKRGNNGTNRSL